jgi:hypothetical protein
MGSGIAWMVKEAPLGKEIDETTRGRKKERKNEIKEEWNPL